MNRNKESLAVGVIAAIILAAAAVLLPYGFTASSAALTILGLFGACAAFAVWEPAEKPEPKPEGPRVVVRLVTLATSTMVVVEGVDWAKPGDTIRVSLEEKRVYYDPLHGQFAEVVRVIRND